MRRIYYFMLLILLSPVMAMADFFWVAVLAKESGLKEQRTLYNTNLDNLAPDLPKELGRRLQDHRYFPLTQTLVCSAK